MPPDAIFGNLAADQVTNKMFADFAGQEALDFAGQEAMSQAAFPEALSAGAGFFADKGNVNMLNLGLKGLGLANTMSGQKEAIKASKQNRRLNADAYNRNVAADERRREINF